MAQEPCDFRLVRSLACALLPTVLFFPSMTCAAHASLLTLRCCAFPPPSRPQAVLGGGGVGKSALTNRMVSDTFLEDYDPTIEDLYRLTLQVDGAPAVLDVLDTAGQDEYNSMQDGWMRDSEGFLLVYSVTSRATLNEAKTMYDKILRTKDATRYPIVLVGNKADLDAEREVSTAEGAQTAQAFGGPFLEASAKTRVNVAEAFQELVRQVREHKSAAKKPVRKKRSCTIL